MTDTNEAVASPPWRDALSDVIARGLLATAIVISLTGSGLAQSAGTITGTIKDASGAMLPGATVTAVNVVQDPSVPPIPSSAGAGRGPPAP
jgi:hypothetical protein